MTDPLSREVLADLKLLPTHVRREIRPALQRAAKPIADRAKAKASWSRRIPGSIRVSVLKRGVEIRAGRKKAPHARPYEGITGKGSFRHPVFGNRSRWVTQKTRPFLRPAALEGRSKVRRELEDIVIKAARARSFR